MATEIVFYSLYYAEFGPLTRHANCQRRRGPRWDMGDSRNHTLLAGEDPSVDLSSVGFGFRYTLKSGWLLRFDYGQAINRLTPNDARDGRVHLGLIVSY